jgi:serine/threonine protein kinase
MLEPLAFSPFDSETMKGAIGNAATTCTTVETPSPKHLPSEFLGGVEGAPMPDTQEYLQGDESTKSIKSDSTLNSPNFDITNSSEIPQYGDVIGVDANGYFIYKFEEPLFPLVQNVQPLISQLHQTRVASEELLDFLEICLAWNPRKRSTASKLLSNPLVRNVA